MNGWSALQAWPLWTAAAAIGAAYCGWAYGRKRNGQRTKRPSYESELLDSLYYNSPIAFAVIDRQGRFLDINRHHPSELFGYTKEEMASRPFLGLLHEDSRAGTLEMFHRTLNGEKGSRDIRILDKLGHPVDLNIATAPLIRRGKTVAILVFFQDISERKRALERNHYMAYYDDMTGLPNRRHFMNRLEEKLRAYEGRPEHPAVCYLDLDEFKLVNTSFGRDFGDMLLLQVAERLTRMLSEHGDLARMEGDEFAGYLGEVSDPEEALAGVEELMKLLEEPFELGGVPIHLSASIGIAVRSPGDDAGTLLRKADTALQRAKENGRNDYQLHAVEMDPVAMHKLTFQHEMRKALTQSEFRLYYQPQYDLSTGRIVGLEALLRWKHPERGFISPEEFIPAAEESGLIVPLGDWILEEACRQNKAWQDQGLPKIPVSVNLSMRQFFRRDLTSKVADVLAQTGLDPRYLDFEITESMTMDVERATQCLCELTELGVQVSIDDFGTGYSSFHYLKKLPIGRLKIDRSFVRDIQQDPGDAAIVAAIIAMAHKLQLQVIAEGVETEEQMLFLRTHQCDEMQGFFGSPPLPPEDAGWLLGEMQDRCALPAYSESASSMPDE